MEMDNNERNFWIALSVIALATASMILMLWWLGAARVGV